MHEYKKKGLGTELMYENLPINTPIIFGLILNNTCLKENLRFMKKEIGLV